MEPPSAGARPKALIADGDRGAIAKFSSSTDPYPVVKAEYMAMELARRAGIDVAAVELAKALGREVLMVRRFDRTPAGARRMTVSALTILERHDAHRISGRHATYAELAHRIRARFTDADSTLRELFSRIVFNILVSNTDDHPGNHSAFWDGGEFDAHAGRTTSARSLARAERPHRRWPSGPTGTA